MEKKDKVLVKNTTMLYLMSIAKIILPLVSLPYLTHVLTEDCYGSISFVKSIMGYMQIIIGFGFLISGTKSLIKVGEDKEARSQEIGDILYSQMLLGVIVVIATLICCFCFPILKGYELYTILSLVTTLLSIFLFEYVFHALEKMEKISIRFVIMKVISVLLTVIFVKGNQNVYLIPVFDIISSLVAVILVYFQLKKLDIKIKFDFRRIKFAFQKLKDSFIYFISNFATTAFSLLMTILIGICLTKEEVAFWSVALQLVGAIQALYSPIIDSVYPRMVKDKDLKIIHKILSIFMPLIFIGCLLILLLGDILIPFVFGESYITSSHLLKMLIPVLIFSFPAMLYGWPCLGSIDKNKETTFSTIISSLVQVLGLTLLIIIKQVNFTSLVIVRCITEFVLFIIRMSLVYKNKKEFVKLNKKITNEDISLAQIEINSQMENLEEIHDTDR